MEKSEKISMLQHVAADHPDSWVSNVTFPVTQEPETERKNSLVQIDTVYRDFLVPETQESESETERKNSLVQIDVDHPVSLVPNITVFSETERKNSVVQIDADHPVSLVPNITVFSEKQEPETERKNSVVQIDADYSDSLVPNVTILPETQEPRTERKNSVELTYLSVGNFKLTITSQPNSLKSQKLLTVKDEHENQSTKNGINMHLETCANASKSSTLIDDQDKMFFNHLLPDLQSFNGEQKLKFRMEILDLLRRIKYEFPKNAVELSSTSPLGCERDDYPLILEALEFYNSQMTRYQKAQLILIDQYHDERNKILNDRSS